MNNLCDDPTVAGYVVSGQVAAGLTDARNRAEFLANHDVRTGLLNRDGFMRAANELIAQGGRHRDDDRRRHGVPLDQRALR